MTLAIRFDNVSKCYRLRKQRPFLLRELGRALLQKPSQVSEHWALRDVSFEITRGMSVGVVGGNGAGKSTLLSLIAKTSYPTRGTVTVHGRVGPMLALGAGFHQDLTGAENIALNAALLGLTREEVAERYDSIVAYADIGEYLDAPIHQYSTGMTARLGFAVVAHVDAEILLLDEVLAVGDAPFQEKCLRTIRAFKESGRTLFFVSHGLAQVVELCSHMAWIRDGTLVRFGPTDEVAPEFEAAMQAKSG